MKKFILLITAFLFAQYLSAQWTQVGYMIVNGTDTSKGCNIIKGFGGNVYCGTSKGLFVSADNGDNWSNLTYTVSPTANEDIASVLVASNGHIFIGSATALYKSTDGGSSWSTVSSLPITGKIWDIAEIGGNIVISFDNSTDAGTYYSPDFGSSWNLSSGINSKVRRFFSDGATVYLGGTSNGVYKSTDNGASWSVAGTGFPATPGIWSVDKIGSKLFAASVTGSGLFESADNGATWVSVAPPVFNGFCQVFSIAQNGSVLLASNDGVCNNGSSIRISTDNGATWNAFLSGITAPFYLPVLGKNSSGTSFFTKRGNGAEVFRYDYSPTSVKNSFSKTDDITLYPNPSTGILNIKGISAANASLVIYNIVGDEAYNFVISQDKATIELPVKGMYLYKIMNDEGRLLKSGKIVIQ